MSDVQANTLIFNNLHIENYKSIKNLNIPLTHFNVFIGANGCGKSNILEAVALVAAEKSYKVKISDLQQIGVRITKPSLMKNSFLGEKSSNKIVVELKSEQHRDNVYLTSNKEDIFADWEDIRKKSVKLELLKKFKENGIAADSTNIDSIMDIVAKMLNDGSINYMLPNIKKMEPTFEESYINGIVYAKNYLIYALNTNALRGLSNESKLQPLGIYGEGLDVLLSTFSKEEWDLLNQYSYLIDWLESIEIDHEDKLKHKGHKLGRSNSLLYFTDKFMRKNNNRFSAENSNEGVLHVLFYLALFISKKTPSFFAIDNIESSLNPRICRALIKELAKLAVQTNKQILITTHNPAILDGLNLNDPNQALFVVKRTDEGYTKADKILIKPQLDNERLKLSEMWMRGHLGGLPNNF